MSNQRTQTQGTQAQARTTNGNNPSNMSAEELLEAIISKPRNQQTVALGKSLDSRIDKIEEMLPDFMKGQGPRLAKRAQMTFDYSKDLWACPPQDFIRCVLEAAEMGFAVDGKMCYVVKYKERYQCQLDYKALVAVAKRMKTIRDIYSDVVCENDIFRASREDGKDRLLHERPLVKGSKRGEVLAAYAVVILSDTWRYELMDRDELDKIQARAPSKKGPWATDPDEMRRKTVVRKTLKMYADDPAVMRIMELTDEEVEIHEESNTTTQAKATAAAQLADRLSDRLNKQPPQKPSQTRQDAPESTGQNEGRDADRDEQDPFGDEGADGRLDYPDGEPGRDVGQAASGSSQREDIQFGGPSR